MAEFNYHCHGCDYHGPGFGKPPQCPNCAALLKYPDGRSIEVRGANASEVSEVAAQLAADAAASATSRPRNPWLSGSFYLISAVVVGVLVLVTAATLPLWAVPVTLVASLLLLITIGAFQLRQDQALSQIGFLKLMQMTLQRLPLLVARGRSRAKSEVPRDED